VSGAEDRIRYVKSGMLLPDFGGCGFVCPCLSIQRLAKVKRCRPPPQPAVPWPLCAFRVFVLRHLPSQLDNHV